VIEEKDSDFLLINLRQTGPKNKSAPTDSSDPVWIRKNNFQKNKKWQ